MLVIQNVYLYQKSGSDLKLKHFWWRGFLDTFSVISKVWSLLHQGSVGASSEYKILLDIYIYLCHALRIFIVVCHQEICIFEGGIFDKKLLVELYTNVVIFLWSNWWFRESANFKRRVNCRKKNNSLFVSKLLMHDDASILAKIKSTTCNRYYMTVTK